MTDFSVTDHLGDRTTAALLELGRHATIGSPAHEVAQMLDEDNE